VYPTAEERRRKAAALLKMAAERKLIAEGLPPKQLALWAREMEEHLAKVVV
jgi:hypothetical protein